MEWAVETVFPDAHRHERLVVTQDQSLDCRRLRLYGNHLREFIERWGLMTRGVDMTVPESLFTAPLPIVAAYLRSVFQAEGYVSQRERIRQGRNGHDLGGRRPRRPAAADALRHLQPGSLQGGSACRPQGLLVAVDPGCRRPTALRRRDRLHRRPEGGEARGVLRNARAARRRAEAARDRAHRDARRDGRLRHSDRER